MTSLGAPVFPQKIYSLPFYYLLPTPRSPTCLPLLTPPLTPPIDSPSTHFANSLAWMGLAPHRKIANFM